jgi:hypothetical protein
MSIIVVTAVLLPLSSIPGGNPHPDRTSFKSMALWLSPADHAKSASLHQTSERSVKRASNMNPRGATSPGRGRADLRRLRGLITMRVTKRKRNQELDFDEKRQVSKSMM